jgi:hypothetical protein
MEQKEGQGRPTKQKTVSSEPQAAEGFKRVFKGSREVVHDLFELKPAIFKQNISYQFFKPNLVDIEHKHFFHSIDKRGLPNHVSSDTAGHFHNMVLKADKDGNMVVECGPPMRSVVKKNRGKETVVIEQVFYGATSIGDEGAIVDDHTHDINYIHAEKLTF